MPTIEIILPPQRYAIHIAAGNLRRLGELVRAVVPQTRAALLMDGNVAGRFGAVATEALRGAGYEVCAGELVPGEAHKTLDAVRALYDVLLNARLERRSPVIALGGGVTGDTVGFAAATYLRGVPLVQCPTTLLAMVDSSVGGKVGVDVPQGKNLIGAFYQPRLVVVDPDTLGTLPARELRCGLAECVKHAVIRDAALFDWMDVNLARIQQLDSATLVELIRRNVEIKAKVVMADEKETGERAHLNFGHTFGHALETVTGYGKYHHGEAVALGMLVATRLAVALRRCDPALLPKLAGLLTRIGLPTRDRELPSTASLWNAMRSDKKVAEGTMRFVLPERLGGVGLYQDIPPAAVQQAWDCLRA